MNNDMIGQTIICLFLTAALAGSTSGQNDPAVIFQYTTESNGDFYLGEGLKVSCKGENFTPADTTRLNHLYAKSNGEHPSHKGCAIKVGEWIDFGSLPSEVVELDTSINGANCKGLEADQWYIETTLNTTEALKEFTLSCRAYAPSEINSVESLKVTEIKVAPVGLNMAIPDAIVELQEFTVSCEPTTNGSPASQYEYDILRGGNVIQNNIAGGRYTPTVDDRGGFTVRCRDIMHSNWKTPADVIATEEILPKFIGVGGDGDSSPTVSLNPAYNSNTLTCNIIAQTGAVISHTWTSSVMSEAEVRTRVLTLSSRENVQNGDTEDITCEGSVAELTKSITWTITWNKQATTTQTLITRPQPKDGSVAVSAGVGATVAVVVIIIIIVAVVMCRKRKGTNSDSGVDADTTLHLQSLGSVSDEYESPPVRTDSSSNVASTTSKTYERLQMPDSDGVYSQPDEHLYSGLMKRTQLIQPTNQRDTTAGSSDYVNCANLTPQ